MLSTHSTLYLLYKVVVKLLYCKLWISITNAKTNFQASNTNRIIDTVPRLLLVRNRKIYVQYIFHCPR